MRYLSLQSLALGIVATLLIARASASKSAEAETPSLPSVRMLTSFEDKNPFEGGEVVTEHASDGKKALRLEKGYAVWSGPQTWAGFDYLKADLHTDSEKPISLYIEIADHQTREYWTRVNYETLVPPGTSTLVIPLQQLYVGEKARPGRNLILSGITRLVLSLGEHPTAPLFLDNLRLERDVETPKMLFEGLHAYSFGPATGPLMPGFTRIDPSTIYTKARGYGLKNASVWRAIDARQPEPLYQNCLCIERGGLAVDVPNGRYHVFVNIDNPSGFWGEYQNYRKRSILAQGRPVVEESMAFDSFKTKYFRNWETEDLPSDNTFDKYQRPYFQEKQFDVDVTDERLMLEFRGENVACSVSAVIFYPIERSAEGEKFLDHVVRKRRFFFDNYFHRVLHRPTGDPLAPTPADVRHGCVAFTRDTMQDVYYNDTPKHEEIGHGVSGFAFAGQYEPLTLSIVPLADLGTVSVAVSDLTGSGLIAAKDISVGYVSNRITRVSSDGAVYTIAPRLIVPRNVVKAPASISRRLWLTVHVPPDAMAGLYHGRITVTSVKAEAFDVPVEFHVYPGTLDAADLPIGPFSHTIDTPWPSDDTAALAWNRTMAERSLRKLHDYGFTTFTGIPQVSFLGFKDGTPQFDFREADRQMELARHCGFTMPVITYTGLPGLNLYFKDEAAMKAAGFKDYTQFVQAIFSAIQSHATAARWLPVYWNLGDEPVGDDVIRASENAEAYRAAFPSGPPLFTAPTSFDSGDAKDPHFRFAKALHAVALNGHSEPGIRLIQQAGSSWGFYNGGNRWTYGVYLYKAAKQFDMKFRVSWHWNACAGDPYYALDCREDDYAWCNTNPDGELVSTVEFEREYHAGLDDYRHLITLARLAAEHHNAAALDLIDHRMAAFKLGQREHDPLFPPSDWREFRRSVADSIARLRGSSRD